MSLVELIDFFRNDGDKIDFLKKFNLNSDSEVIEAYTVKPLSINSDLSFFEIEKTQGLSIYLVNGIEYHNLFDFYYFEDFIKESKSSNLSNEEIAKLLLKYSIHDA